MMKTMRFLFMLWLAQLAFSSCSEKPSAITPPSNLIVRDTFVTVLAEVRLLEGAYSTSYERVDSSEFPISAHYNRLFNRHNITRDQYLSTYDFYSMHSEQMLEIESAVALRLEQLKWSRDSISGGSR